MDETDGNAENGPIGRSGYERKARKAAKSQELATERAARRASTGNVDIGEPMFVWIMLLLIAVVVRFVMTYTSLVPARSSMYPILQLYSRFLFTPPGIFVLPLIVGAIIGAEVGSRSFSMKSAAKSGFLNGVYAAIVYVVTIIILSVLLDYITTGATQLSSLIGNTIVLPVIVLIVVLEAFAVLSYSRKTDS